MCRVSFVIKLLKLVWINILSLNCEYVLEVYWMLNKLIFGRFVLKMDKFFKVIFLKLGIRDVE